MRVVPPPAFFSGRSRRFFRPAPGRLPPGAFIVLFALLPALLAGPAEPAAPKPETRPHPRTGEIVSRLQRKYETTQALSADFEQENHLRTLGRVTRAKGRFYLHKPGRIRAEYTEPEAQLVVSSGKRLWIYTPRLKQVIVSDLGGGSSSLPLLFLAGKGDLRREFRVVLEDEGVPPRKGGAWRAGQPHRLSLQPVNQAAGFRKMWIEADPESFQITGVEYDDALGNKTRIRFTNMKEGAVLPPALFEFDIPPGVQVLRTPGTKRR